MYVCVWHVSVLVGSYDALEHQNQFSHVSIVYYVRAHYIQQATFFVLNYTCVKVHSLTSIFPLLNFWLEYGSAFCGSILGQNSEIACRCVFCKHWIQPGLFSRCYYSYGSMLLEKLLGLVSCRCCHCQYALICWKWSASLSTSFFEVIGTSRVWYRRGNP